MSPDLSPNPEPTLANPLANARLPLEVLLGSDRGPNRPGRARRDSQGSLPKAVGRPYLDDIATEL